MSKCTYYGSQCCYVVVSEGTRSKDSDVIWGLLNLSDQSQTSTGVCLIIKAAYLVFSLPLAFSLPKYDHTRTVDKTNVGYMRVIKYLMQLVW